MIKSQVLLMAFEPEISEMEYAEKSHYYGWYPNVKIAFSILRSSPFH